MVKETVCASSKGCPIIKGYIVVAVVAAFVVYPPDASHFGMTFFCPCCHVLSYCLPKCQLQEIGTPFANIKGVEQR